MIVTLYTMYLAITGSFIVDERIEANYKTVWVVVSVVLFLLVLLLG